MQTLISTRSRRGQMIVALVVFALGAAMLIAAGRPAHAANGVTIVVNTTGDAPPDATHCGNPVVTCTLRDAIFIANMATDDIIHLPEIPSGTATVYRPPVGAPSYAVSASMTIAGDDPRLVAVDGATDHSVFSTGNGNNPPTITITGITIQNGNAGTGGGIVNSNASLNLGNDIIANNVATGINIGGRGGGIFSGIGLINIQSTTFSNNVTNEVQNAVARGAVAPRATLTGVGQGGGIYNSAGTASSQLTLTNDTFNGNSSGQGGAVWTAAPATLNNDTIVGNSAVNPVGIASVVGGGGVYANAIMVTLHNTIVAKNLNSSDCGPNPAGFASTGHNIDSDNSCNLTGSGDQPSKDPQVQPLAFNAPPVSPPSGFPNTMAIGPGSPALDTADNTNCPIADERGTNRPQNGICDIGAFEFVPPAVAVAPGLPPTGASTALGQPLYIGWLALALLAIGALGTLWGGSASVRLAR